MYEYSFLDSFGDHERKTGHCAVTFEIGVGISGIEDVGKPNILVPLGEFILFIRNIHVFRTEFIFLL